MHNELTQKDIEKMQEEIEYRKVTVRKESQLKTAFTTLKSELKTLTDTKKNALAELANVEDQRDGETNSDVLWRCNDCITKCRTIAEEGTEDEGK